MQLHDSVIQLAGIVFVINCLLALCIMIFHDAHQATIDKALDDTTHILVMPSRLQLYSMVCSLFSRLIHQYMPLGHVLARVLLDLEGNCSYLGIDHAEKSSKCRCM